MAQIGKVLRWFFGINALLFAAICAQYSWRLPHVLWLDLHNLHPARLNGILLGSTIITIGTVSSLALTVIFSMAWWTLGAGKPTARRWAIAASLVSVPFFWFGPPARLSTVAGIVGLLVFSRRATVKEMTAKAAKKVRLPGDGTSAAIEAIANVVMIGAVVLSGSFWNIWAIGQDLPVDRSWWLVLARVEAASLITTGVHELGHLIAALALRMKVEHVRVGPCEWAVRDGKWRFRFRAGALILATGEVGAVPPSMEDLRRRLIFFSAAGPVASLCLGLAATGATLTAAGEPWEQSWKLLSYIATFSLLAFIFNLIPMAGEGQYSDGASIYQLLSRSGPGDLRVAMSMIGFMQRSPLRPRDLDVATLERAAAYLATGSTALFMRIHTWAHYYDAGQIPEALQAMADAESVYTRSAPGIPAGLHQDMIFANAFVKADAVAARLWWERMAATKEKLSGVDYWKAICALLLSEGQLAEAATAWERGNALANECSSAGTFEFDRDCFVRLRHALDVASLQTIGA